MRTHGVLAGLVAGALLAAATPAVAQEYAALDTAGPKLNPSRADLRASLDCTADVRDAATTPVLLLSGTTVDPIENFAWNWMPALDQARIPWCAATAPEPDNMDDAQERGEFIVYAIRRMHRLADRRIAIFGHSQGGMIGRWALRFWPDTRKLVSDVVGAAPSNQGTDLALGICAVPCAPSFWQQRTGSDFLTALNSRAETFRRIAYTNVYSHYDEVVSPNADATGRSSLHTGRGRIANIAAQDVCPGDLSEHLLLGTIDPVAWELFLDAVTHPGPADPSRLPASVCSRNFMPGVDENTYTTDLAAAGVSLANTIAIYPTVPAEPPLRPYVFAR